MVHELGLFDVRISAPIPEEASWVVAFQQDYGNPNLLVNPGFELGSQGWPLYTPPDTIPMTVDIRPGVVGNSVVMVSDELGYKAGIRQGLKDVPPNTTFRFKAMIKTVDAEALEARVLHYGIWVDGVWSEEGTWGYIKGSNDWALYEVSFTVPEGTTSVQFFPALVYNRGEVWIDEASLTIEGLQPPTTHVILNCHAIHSAWDPFNPFVTEADLTDMEQGLISIPIENFWGIIFISEEHYKTHIGFNDDVNTTWFGEVLLGYPLYLAESTGATVDQWKDEMFLRMIRGFYNYFHPLTKVGITASASSTVPWWKESATKRGVPYYFGEPAMAFIREHYDFVVLYSYTKNLEGFKENTRRYFQLIDQIFQRQKKFWILTRDWSTPTPGWELEAMAPELKNCFDRNIVVTPYYGTIPPLEEVWPLMLKALELYNQRAPYTESLVHDTNLLTGFTNETYGWVANPEHDEGLYPTPPFSLGILMPSLVIGGVLLLKTKYSKL